MATQVTDALKTIIRTQRPWFERTVLQVMISSREAYTRNKGLICSEMPALGGKKTKQRYKDFLTPADNVLWQAIELARTGAPSAEALSFSAILPFLHQAKHDARLLDHEFIDLIQRIPPLCTKPDAPIVEMVTNAVPEWIGYFRTKALAARSQGSNFDPETLSEELGEVRRATSLIRHGETMGKFGAGVTAKEPPVERFPLLSFPKLTRQLGGGPGRGEYYLVIAPQSGGKTVMALQLAYDLATSGRTPRRVMYVFTEQTQKELEVRLISARTDIDFNLIKDGINWDTLPPDKIAKAQAVIAELENAIVFVDWTKDKSKGVTQNLEEEVHTFTRKYGPPDAIVFDWIGGALGEIDKNNMAFLRMVYQQASDKLANLANVYQIPVFSFAQAAMAQAANKPRVDQTMIAECKSLGNNATGVWGISALTEAFDPNSPGSEATFRDDQNLYLAKARKSQGGLVKLRREFAWQRFREA